MNWATLCPAETIAPGQSRGFDPLGSGRASLFVVNWQGQWRAWEDWCPHWQTGPMAWRKDAYWSGDGQALACHAHGARFDPLTGLCTLGPCLGQSLRSVPLRQDTQGWLQVDTAGLHAIRNEEPTGSDTFNQGDTT